MFALTPKSARLVLTSSTENGQSVLPFLKQTSETSSETQGLIIGRSKVEWVPGGSLGSIFAGYVPLVSRNPYPIIDYFWSILWLIIGPILVTFGHYSPFLVYFVASGRHLSHFWAKDFLNLNSKSRKRATPFWLLYWKFLERWLH